MDGTKKRRQSAIEKAPLINEAEEYIKNCIVAAPNKIAKSSLDFALRHLAYPRKRERSRRSKDQNATAQKERFRVKNTASMAFATNARQRWTIDQDRIVLDSVMSDFDIAIALGRSAQAINLRRSRLKAPN